MEWLTQLFEAIRSYPLESIGAAVGGLFVSFGGWKGLTALYDLIFSKTKKTINKINDNVNVKIAEVKDIFAEQVNSLKADFGSLKADLAEFKGLIEKIPTNAVTTELMAYINAVKQSSSDLAVKYEKELTRLKSQAVNVTENLTQIATETAEETVEEVQAAIEEVKQESKKIRLKRK